MSLRKIRDFLIPIVTVLIILSISAAVIAYGKGYRLDITQKSVKPTGLIAATSDPVGARVYINGELKTATNNTINVIPGWYKTTIAKEGYQPWEKNLRVQGEIVTRADAYLFPTNPSLSAVSTSGVASPALSPDGGRLAFVIPEGKTATADGALVSRAGVWVLDLVDKPLGINRDARQIAKTSYIDFSESRLIWSPDGKNILATVIHPITLSQSNYLLDADKLNDSPVPVYDLAPLSVSWEELKQVKEKEKLTILKPIAIQALTPVMRILSFSPDETKILYEATASATIPQIIKPPLIGTNPTEENRTLVPETLYVYDIKEDRNYPIGNKYELGFPKPAPVKNKQAQSVQTQSANDIFSLQSQNILPVFWLPTSRHLIIVTKGKIEAVDYDATNRMTIYSGPFEDGFVIPWSSAAKILILTTFTPAAGNTPNLYAVNLR